MRKLRPSDPGPAIAMAVLFIASFILLAFYVQERAAVIDRLNQLKLSLWT